MKVAVLTLTRDRLDYTKRCFGLLHKHAGCRFDHFVLDQGSHDGTPEWLATYEPTKLILSPENVGISRGMNLLLDAARPINYDCIVKFDNDCELTQPDTLRDIATLANIGTTPTLLSPRILGLKNPPGPSGLFYVGDERVQDIPQIGGIFLAAPAYVYDDFRYSESNPLWGMDDVEICRWVRGRGGRCGYVERLEAWHHETTDGQRERFPDYFVRKDREFAS